MKYKKISDGTVQCIIFKEDMDEFGLSISDIFERNEKGEDFLRTIIANAYEEVGYEANGANIAMQITPLQDKGMIITFSSEGPAAFQQMLEHIKQALTGTGMDLQKALEQLHGMRTENENASTKEEKNAVKREAKKFNDAAPVRVFEFETMHDVIAFCNIAFGEQKFGSVLYKDNENYYLVLIKKRMSWKDFNLLSVRALDFASPIPCSEHKVTYLEEHGDCIFTAQAVGKIKKIFVS